MAGLALAASALLLTVLAACAGPQSTLDPAGRAAEEIASLWWWMAGGALLVWATVVGLAVYAIRADPERHTPREAGWFIIGGGVVLPTLVLTGLLLYGLGRMPALLEPGAEGLRIHVSGEEWWWRVEYRTADGDTIASANEVRLPSGRRTELTFESPDVIHSFWIPALGGKMDLIPGRTTRMALEPTRTGTFRGQCAEYCGLSHARMAFLAVVMEPAAFEEWLQRQALPARPPTEERVARGREAFLRNGCGACHTVRGTPANGAVGPDLTHVGGRESLAAGTLANDAAAFRRWITSARDLKPGAHMPSFGMLPDRDIEDISAWLESLR